MGDKPATLGEYLKASRTSRGWSLRDMQARTGLNPSTLKRIEDGFIATPTPDALLAIIDALDLNPHTVVGYLGSYTRLIQAVLAVEKHDGSIKPEGPSEGRITS